MIQASFVHDFRVALHDTDAAGVMFFANLFRHAHDGYEGFMATIGWPLDGMIRERSLSLPLVHAEADFRRPMQHGQRVRVGVSVADVGSVRFTIGYRFTDPDGDLLASAWTIHVAIDPLLSKPIPLPPELVAALEEGSL